ncbi:MAG: hypothetical protein GEU86_14200 [Actinophytocola sp.]|nr:hypothetical protein [Actinophytocola sp.]
MDERELETLFREAPGEAPPATFDAADVAAASRRATARHRMRVATAASFTALVLAGGALFATIGPLSGDEQGAGTAVSAQMGESADEPQPNSADARQESGGLELSREAAPKQGGEDSSLDAADPEVAERTYGCESIDRKLADALAGELPVGPSRAPDPVPGIGPCVDGGSNAAYEVSDGEASGLISVAIIPASDGEAMALSDEDSRTRMAQARTDGGSGDIVVVSSKPAPGSPAAPLPDELQRIADAIAAGR